MSAEHKRKIREGVRKYHDCARKAGCGNKRKKVGPATKPKKKAPLKIKKKVGPPTKPKKKAN